MIEITSGVVLGDEEITFVTSRSGGPGGQNVNKVETRVTLYFDLEASPGLNEAEKARVRDRLATRISKAGVMRVTAQKHRTQAANREEALERFRVLLAEALAKEAPRKRTRPSREAKERRLEEKKRRGAVKRGRAWSPPEEP